MRLLSFVLYPSHDLGYEFCLTLSVQGESVTDFKQIRRAKLNKVGKYGHRNFSPLLVHLVTLGFLETS